MQQHQHHYIDRRRPRLIDNNNKTRNDEFYAKLERIRLTAAASSSKQCSHRSATEILNESKAFFVKSQEVLHNRQTLLNNRTLNEDVRCEEQQQLTPTYRIPQPRRSPYFDYENEDQQYRFDSFELPLEPSLPSNSIDGGIFESVSLLSLSDQTTLDSENSPSNIKRTVLPSTSLTVIERNARIIKWLFQLNKANSSHSFPQVQ